MTLGSEQRKVSPSPMRIFFFFFHFYSCPRRVLFSIFLKLFAVLGVGFRKRKTMIETRRSGKRSFGSPPRHEYFHRFCITQFRSVFPKFCEVFTPWGIFKREIRHMHTHIYTLANTSAPLYRISKFRQIQLRDRVNSTLTWDRCATSNVSRQRRRRRRRRRWLSSIFHRVSAYPIFHILTARLCRVARTIYLTSVDPYLAIRVVRSSRLYRLSPTRRLLPTYLPYPPIHLSTDSVDSVRVNKVARENSFRGIARDRYSANSSE